MSFLVLLLVVLILRFTPWRHGFPIDLPERWARIARDRCRLRPEWQTLVLLALPLPVVGWLLWVLQEHAYGLLTLVAHVALVLVAVGRSDPLGTLAKAFEEAWKRDDKEAANHIARRDMQVASDEPEELLQGVDACVASATFRDYVAPVFWYLLLGPLGPLGYRLLDRFESLDEHPAVASVRRITHALEWLPARLFVLSMALVGDFERTLGSLKIWLLRWEATANEVVASCTSSALGDEQHKGDASMAIMQPVRALMIRSLSVWAVCIAFISLLG
jgi:AmpE protein